MGQILSNTAQKLGTLDSTNPDSAEMQVANNMFVLISGTFTGPVKVMIAGEDKVYVQLGDDISTPKALKLELPRLGRFLKLSSNFSAGSANYEVVQ